MGRRGKPFTKVASSHLRGSGTVGNFVAEPDKPYGHRTTDLGDRTELARAKAMGHSCAVPYLDWWALANSADIVVRRHAGCIPQASTFSTTARAWGLDVERASKRARPDFDGLV